MSGEHALTVHRDPVAIGEVLARSGYFTDAKAAAQAAVKVMAGEELGIGPVAAMNGIHVVKGKPALSAALMVALVNRTGTMRVIVKRHTDTECALALVLTATGVEIGESVFTIADAAQAGLAGSDTWKQYPRNMLYARAASNLVRWHCPEVTMGPVYTPEELGADVTVTQDGTIEVIEPAAAVFDGAAVIAALALELGLDLEEAKRIARAAGVKTKGALKDEGLVAVALTAIRDHAAAVDALEAEPDDTPDFPNQGMDLAEHKAESGVYS